MRALWSQVKKHDFFRFLKIGKSFLDIFKMSIFENPNFKKTKIPSFSSLSIFSLLTSYKLL
jgi:hypothetical protein